MLTPDGVVKILDFGLAKLDAPQSGTGLLSQLETAPGRTEPGVIVGTVGYMSPEQASGAPIDFRSDQFSFGTILHEMATGRRAFQRTTAVETMAAIVREEPASLGSVRPDVPAPLRWLVERCLSKEPRARYASTEDLAHDLATLRDRLSEAAAPAAPASPPSRRGAMVAGWALRSAPSRRLLLSVVRGREGPPASAGIDATITQLTNYGDREDSGTISPDGRQFAFVSGKGGSRDIWVRQVSGGEPRQVTRDDAEETDLVYAPDGESLYYVTWGPDRPSIWRIPALGGTPRKIAGRGAVSRAGGGRKATRLGALVHSRLSSLGRSRLRRDQQRGRIGARKLYEGLGIGSVSWSPDGRRLAFTAAPFFETRNLHILDVESAREHAVTRFPSGSLYSQAWLPDSRNLVFSRVASGYLLGTTADLGIVSEKERSSAG